MQCAEKNNPSSGYSVCLMGAQLNTGNMGVAALCASCVKIIRLLKPDAEINLLIGHRSADPQVLQLAGEALRLRVLNYRLSPKSVFHQHLLGIFFLACLQKIMPLRGLRIKIIETNEFLQTMHAADFVGDIRGGDSFSDIYGLRRFLIGLMPAIIAILLGKKLVLLPQTYGPYNSAAARLLARFIIARSFYACSRDRQGVTFLTDTSNSPRRRPRVVFCPDVAFLLDSIQPPAAEIQPPLPSWQASPVIGININGLMYNGGYTRSNMFRLQFDYKVFAAHLVQACLEQTDAHILLVPHAFGLSGNVNSDPDATRDLLSTVPETRKNRIHLLMQQHNQSEMKGLIGMCDFFIGSRMHACIAALSQGIPTVAIAYSHKFFGVFDSIGSGHTVIDARTTGEGDALQQIFEAYKKRNTLGTDAQAKVARAQRTIVSVFRDMLCYQ
ncbi:MAG: polysaccharide pyruvyl transferase family protein [Deltaproteobacteria bacterium]|nr:polysaccharide pyruvyl transferase family protein [Deltaproteobacteria bacterium]